MTRRFSTRALSLVGLLFTNGICVWNPAMAFGETSHMQIPVTPLIGRWCPDHDGMPEYEDWHELRADGISADSGGPEARWSLSGALLTFTPLSPSDRRRTETWRVTRLTHASLELSLEGSTSGPRRVRLLRCEMAVQPR